MDGMLHLNLLFTISCLLLFAGARSQSIPTELDPCEETKKFLSHLDGLSVLQAWNVLNLPLSDSYNLREVSKSRDVIRNFLENNPGIAEEVIGNLRNFRNLNRYDLLIAALLALDRAVNSLLVKEENQKIIFYLLKKKYLHEIEFGGRNFDSKEQNEVFMGLVEGLVERECIRRICSNPRATLECPTRKSEQEFRPSRPQKIFSSPAPVFTFFLKGLPLSRNEDRKRNRKPAARPPKIVFEPFTRPLKSFQEPEIILEPVRPIQPSRKRPFKRYRESEIFDENEPEVLSAEEEPERPVRPFRPILPHNQRKFPFEPYQEPEISDSSKIVPEPTKASQEELEISEASTRPNQKKPQELEIEATESPNKPEEVLPAETNPEQSQEEPEISDLPTSRPVQNIPENILPAELENTEPPVETTTELSPEITKPPIETPTPVSSYPSERKFFEILEPLLQRPEAELLIEKVNTLKLTYQEFKLLLLEYLLNSPIDPEVRPTLERLKPFYQSSSPIFYYDLLVEIPKPSPFGLEKKYFHEIQIFFEKEIYSFNLEVSFNKNFKTTLREVMQKLLRRPLHPELEQALRYYLLKFLVEESSSRLDAWKIQELSLLILDLIELLPNPKDEAYETTAKFLKGKEAFEALKSGDNSLFSNDLFTLETILKILLQGDLDQKTREALEVQLKRLEANSIRLVKKKEIRKEFKLIEILEDTIEFDRLNLQGKKAFKRFYQFISRITAEDVKEFNSWDQVETRGGFMKVFLSHLLTQDSTPKEIKEAILVLDPEVKLDGTGLLPP